MTFLGIFSQEKADRTYGGIKNYDTRLDVTQGGFEKLKGSESLLRMLSEIIGLLYTYSGSVLTAFILTRGNEKHYS